MTGLPTPIIGLVIAVFVLIFLVTRTKVHALIAMLAAACIAGIVGGLSLEDTLSVITRGFGSTLGSIGLVIGLGVMMGRILEVSGAAEQIAFSFITWFGKRREEWALAFTGYVVSIPIFVDSAFVVLYPLAKALAKRGKRSLLTLGVALGGGLVVTHHTVPPTPGPLGVAGLFGVDMGAMLLAGMALAVPCVIGVVLYAQWLDKRYPGFVGSALTDEGIKTAHDDYRKEKINAPLPRLTLSLLPILVPIALIFIKATLNALAGLPGMEGMAEGVLVFVLGFAGTPFIALAIGVLLAVYTLVPHLDRQATSAQLEEGLQSAGIILLVTGAGGALGTVLRESGAGEQLAEQVASLPVSPVMIPFIVATLVRLIQGSGTVAMVTAASISAPILAPIPGLNTLLAAQAATMGSLFFSYFNDSLFWVVNRLMGISGVKQQLMAWSIPTTIAWAIGGTGVAVLNLLFGTGGTLFDPLLPLVVLLFVFLVVRRKQATASPPVNGSSPERE
jgi:GntP family gluconate:H+ symporter